MSSEQGKLQPIPLRREDDPNYEPEIWQPNWKCFCCEDTGLARQAAFRFIEGYILEKRSGFIGLRDLQDLIVVTTPRYRSPSQMIIL